MFRLVNNYFLFFFKIIFRGVFSALDPILAYDGTNLVYFDLDNSYLDLGLTYLGLGLTHIGLDFTRLGLDLAHLGLAVWSSERNVQNHHHRKADGK